MLQRTHELFISYSRRDNQPPSDGWVSTFVEQLRLRHLDYSGRELHIFFDELVEAGVELDPPMGQLHDQLSNLFQQR